MHSFGIIKVIKIHTVKNVNVIKMAKTQGNQGMFVSLRGT